MDDHGKMTMAYSRVVMRKDFLRVGFAVSQTRNESIAYFVRCPHSPNWENWGRKKRLVSLPNVSLECRLKVLCLQFSSDTPLTEADHFTKSISHTLVLHNSPPLCHRRQLHLSFLALPRLRSLNAHRPTILLSLFQAAKPPSRPYPHISPLLCLTRKLGY
jgi:hypothetical protein